MIVRVRLIGLHSANIRIRIFLRCVNELLIKKKKKKKEKEKKSRNKNIYCECAHESISIIINCILYHAR